MLASDVEDIKRRLLARRIIDSSTGCWLWSGYRDKGGYGRVSVLGKPYLAHRVAAFIFLGFPLFDNLFVLHRCDTPPCFNPEHLFIGTHRENMKDSWNKGRAYLPTPLRGSTHPRSKLTEDQVLSIRKSVTEGVTQKSLAEVYGVSVRMIYLIVKRKVWKHI